MVWNELGGCRTDVPNLPKECFDEIFAMDGGSTDGTAEYLQSQAIAVIKQPRRGYDCAYVAAFSQSTSDILILFHPKGSVDPGSLREVAAALRTGIQLVVASRNAKGARNEEDGRILKPRKWFVLALSLLSALLWRRDSGPLILDVLHGYRGMWRDAFWGMAPLELGVSMDLQMVVRAYRLGLRRLEVPVIERARPEGTTHFKALPTGLKLLRYMWAESKRGKPRAELTGIRSSAPNP